MAGAGILFLLAASCSEDSPEAPAASATPSSAATSAATVPLPTATSQPADVVFSIDPAADAGDAAIVRGGVEHAIRYLEAAAGQRAVDCTIYMYVLPQRLLAAMNEKASALPTPFDIIASRLQLTASESFPETILIDPTSRVWLQINDLNQFRIAAHEYFHVVQFDLMGETLAQRVFSAPIGSDRPEGPNWLLEGSAEYVSWKALEAAGLGSLDEHLAARPVRPDADLREIETPLGYSTGDEVSLVLPLTAVRLLLADGSPEPVIEFYRLLAGGSQWRSAFESAFGRSVEAFYAEFAAAIR